MTTTRRGGAAVLSAAILCGLGAAGSSAGAPTSQYRPPVALVAAVPGISHTLPGVQVADTAVAAPDAHRRTYQLADGTSASLDVSGHGTYTTASGRRASFWMPVQAGASVPNDAMWPDAAAVQHRIAELKRQGSVRSLIVVFSSASAAPPGSARSASRLAPLTSDPALDVHLRAAGAKSVTPMFAGRVAGTSASGSGIDLARAYVVSIGAADPIAAARRLAGAPGVAYAAPNWTLGSMATGPRPIPADRIASALQASHSAAALKPTAGSIPSNFGVTSSLQSHLNASGVDALGAFHEIAQRFHQLPGTGTIITNVSLGDLTDQGMADAGDPYVQQTGPSTIISGGQRYLDFASLPLIPTFTVDLAGTIDPLGSVEFVDPSLGEVLLDFSVMAPLPRNRQRSDNPGSGFTDLLGIAPGAKYRLIVPAEPTNANILVALEAASRQQPRPDVITASIGFGLDAYGFPGRYFEDDPLAFAIMQTIVRSGIVVTLSANDGTRIFTPAAIGPDGGAVPLDLVPTGTQPTNVMDDGFSTIPSYVPDSGVIAVGGNTLDDIFSAPPEWNVPLSSELAFPETRFNGGTNYASAFGSRVNVSAPSDNIVVLAHICPAQPCAVRDVNPVLEGGTSASAPMVAATAAVMRQVARLTGRDLAPAELRRLLIATGRAMPTPPLADRKLSVGPVIDVTAAVEAVLKRNGVASLTPAIVRIGVAERQSIGAIGASFLEDTNPAAIDLTGPVDLVGALTGQNAVSPITLSADVVGRGDPDELVYRWTIGGTTFPPTAVPSIRLLPAAILRAAGQPLASRQSRNVVASVEVLRDGRSVATSAVTLTFGPCDGTYAEALPPRFASVVQVGSNVRVTYDLAHVRALDSPTLVVSNIDHWSPVAAPIFREAWSTPLAAVSGSIDIPASAFIGGAGVYGIAFKMNAQAPVHVYGRFAAIRVADAATPDCAHSDCALHSRPDAPTVAPDGSFVFGHSVSLNRANPRFQLQWDVTRVAGAARAILEISAPAPSIWGLYNTITNPNGDHRDRNGVDTPSAVYESLRGASGIETFDTLALHLPTSMSYAVRVLAVDGDGKVVGQASPESSFTLDDGLPPDGGTVIDFDVASAHSAGSVAVAQFGPTNEEAASSVYAYDAASGAYGAVLDSDNSGVMDFHAMGSDRQLGRTLVAGIGITSTDQVLNIHDSVTGALLSSTHLDTSTAPFIVGARVDATRHRAAILGWASTDLTDEILPLNMATGALGKPVSADVGIADRGLFTDLEVDPSSGKVFPAHINLSDLCFLSPLNGITSVDIDAGVAQPVVPFLRCASSISSDQRGGSLYATLGPVLSFSLLPDAAYETVDQGSLTRSPLRGFGEQGVSYTAVDPVHNLLLATFLGASDYFDDNNATSAVGVFDLHTGRRVALIRGFNFFAVSPPVNPNYFLQSARGLQLDPVTRTGWTYSTFSEQVQQFSY